MKKPIFSDGLFFMHTIGIGFPLLYVCEAMEANSSQLEVKIRSINPRRFDS